MFVKHVDLPLNLGIVRILLISDSQSVLISKLLTLHVFLKIN